MGGAVRLTVGGAVGTVGGKVGPVPVPREGVGGSVGWGEVTWERSTEIRNKNVKYYEHFINQKLI